MQTQSHYVIENKRNQKLVAQNNAYFARKIVYNMHKTNDLLDGGFGGLPRTS